MVRTHRPVATQPDDRETWPQGFSVTLAWSAPERAQVWVSGDLDYCTSAPLRGAVEEAVDAGARELVIDLSGVTFLDAGGIGVTVLAARRLGARRTFVVCPNRWFRGLFRLTGLDRVLTICPSRDDPRFRPAGLGGETA